MSDLSALLRGFFANKLISEHDASPHTIASYRDTFVLLLRFASEKAGREPHQLVLEDLEAETIAAFLAHLEDVRGNSVATRNTRLAAIHSFFRYASYRCPDHAATISRVLSIPAKRTDRAVVSYLTATEAEAIISAPNPSTWTGRRDHALLPLNRPGVGVFPPHPAHGGTPFKDHEVLMPACFQLYGRGQATRAGANDGH